VIKAEIVKCTSRDMENAIFVLETL